MTVTTARACDPLNAFVAERLEEIAALLEEQRANPFRVQAYRNAADTIRDLDEGVDDVLDREGLAGLDRLPGIGQALARVVDQLVTTGRLPMLDRLRGHPAGVAEKRAAPVRAPVPPRLGRRGRRVARRDLEPAVDDLLEVDRLYRHGADDNTLPLIAPRRFNPTHEKWLPVLHHTLGDWHFTALFSNTARAHELQRTHDWVVIYFENHDHAGQHTVVTASRGELAGRRVVRGRERECTGYYARST